MHRSKLLYLLAPALLLLSAVGRADTGEGSDTSSLPAPADVRSSEARKLVSTCAAALKAARRESAEERRATEDAAVRALVAARDARIARRLVEIAADDDLLTTTRVLALRALPLQDEHGADEADRVERWLVEESERESEARRKGDLGVPVDPRTGDPLAGTPEAEAALRAGGERAGLLAAGISALRTLGHEPKKADEILRPLLQSPFDALAVAAVETAQAWGVREVADELALLLRMYPQENRWETGAVTHISGTNASAKAAWMSLFGHPLKQRARPDLHRALVACAEAWAGRELPDPAACADWLERNRD